MKRREFLKWLEFTSGRRMTKAMSTGRERQHRVAGSSIVWRATQT